MKKEVVGFGALNLDKLYRAKNLAKAGRHEEILDACDAPGGSAANTIAGLANLGLKTGFIGVIGNDSEGEAMLNDLRKRGVDTKGIKKLSGRSGSIIGFIDSRGERTLYPFPGANNRLEKKHIDPSYINGAGFVHMTSFVGEKQFRLQKELLKGLGDIRLSFSPGDLYTKKGYSTLKPFIKKSSVLFLNESEIKQLTGKRYDSGAKALIDDGAVIVAVTLGRKGCFVADQYQSHLIPGYKTHVSDTTGAGDAFAAGFLYTLIRGGTLKQAGINGNKAASICIQKVGARTKLAGKKEIRIR